MATTSWFDYIEADTTTRLALDRQAAAHRESMRELRAQSVALNHLVQLGVEQVKGLATIAIGVEGVREDVGYLRRDVQSLGALFDWRLGQILDQFHDQTKRLDNIEDVLRKPLETQARELWERGQHATARDWTEEAVRFYTEAVAKSPFLYPAHLQLGFLYAYRQFDFVAAAASFKVAARYAATDDPPIAAQALLHLHKMEREAGNLERAWEPISRSCQLDATLGPAWWDRATLAIGLERFGDVIPSLEGAIEADPLYWHRAREEQWGSVQRDVDAFLAKLHESARMAAPSAFSTLKSTIDTVHSFVQRLPHAMVRRARDSTLELDRRMDELSVAVKSESFAVLQAAIAATRAQREQLHEYFRPIREFLTAERDRLEQEGKALSEKEDAELAAARHEVDEAQYQSQLIKVAVVSVPIVFITLLVDVGTGISCLFLFGLVGGVYFYIRSRNLAKAEASYADRVRRHRDALDHHRAVLSTVDATVRMFSSTSL